MSESNKKRPLDEESETQAAVTSAKKKVKEMIEQATSATSKEVMLLLTEVTNPNDIAYIHVILEGLESDTVIHNLKSLLRFIADEDLTPGKKAFNNHTRQQVKNL